MSNSIAVAQPKAVIKQSSGVRVADDLSYFSLSCTEDSDEVAVVFDYSRCERGIPYFRIGYATGSEDAIPFRVTYSETLADIDCDEGDGPFFLFSNAMDSYRSCVHRAKRSRGPQLIEARHGQFSQRYQKISLSQPGTHIEFSEVGFRAVRPEIPATCSFSCSDELLNRVWKDGVRTLDMCTVRKGETIPAWDVTTEGTKVYGGHWAPCRKGTQWTDMVVRFKVRVDSGGASWGVRMVANGLIFCLDVAKNMIFAFEGLASVSSIMPTIPRGSWDMPSDLDLSDWLSVSTIASGKSVTVTIGNHNVLEINDIQITPLLSAPSSNTGSIAFGGPEGWVSTYQSLLVTDLDGRILYENGMLERHKEATFADFQVGTNPFSCTIDGAKRDRACFGGDVFVMGRSLAYSTGDLDAWKGSIQLLTSHQEKNGYLGNLCTIQSPEHEEIEEPPSYAFYSLTYALLLVVSAKDYWMHSGDDDLIQSCWPKLVKLVEFTESHVNQDGLIEAPPHLSMTWFPMGGPIIGVSTGLNLAYYDALRSMSEMSVGQETQAWYLSRAERLKVSLHQHLWNPDLGMMVMATSSPRDGYSQEVNGYAITTKVASTHPKSAHNLSHSDNKLPPAFIGLGHWDKFGVSSPYASGFAVEALFSIGEGEAALGLLRKVWSVMSDPLNPNYSGAHWEAMTVDGMPFGHGVSLAHGWSTWPVFLMPRYILGLYPASSGWTKIGIEPVFCGLDSAECSVQTLQGEVRVRIALNDDGETGVLSTTIPLGCKAVVKLPKGWAGTGSAEIVGDGNIKTMPFRKSDQLQE